MSSITADGHAAPVVNDAGGDIGPLEQKHLQYANYRAVAGSNELTKTLWHIATANALGWGFDGMDGVIFALISPMETRKIMFLNLFLHGNHLFDLLKEPHINLSQLLNGFDGDA